MTQNERISIPLWKKIIIISISLIFFYIQIMLLFIFFEAYFNYTKRINNAIGITYSVIWITSIIFVLYIMKKNISANFKLAWSILILLFPLPFIMLYIFNNLTLLSKKRQRKALNKFQNKEELIDLKLPEPLKLLQKEARIPVYKNYDFKFFKDINLKHNDLLLEIKNAKKYILLEYFIINKGQLIDEIIEQLKIKGSEGVKIYILYDDVGSKGGMKKSLLKELIEIDNCKVASFQPLGINLNLLANYRDHRKIAVIDGNIAYCGGDNLSDEYINKKERFGYWRDNCGKYKGQIVDSFVKLFIEMWYLSTKELLELELYNHDSYENNGYAAAFGDGPLYKENISYDLFCSLIINAKKYIYISTPYFIIDDTLLSLIELKIKSGVDVKILMPGIPDKKSAYYMGRENYGRIIKAGGKVYEYTPGFNHAKNIIVDDEFIFIGTVNFDYRSLFLHYECGACLACNHEIAKMKENFLDAVAVSKEISYNIWYKRPIKQKILAFILNLFATLF